MWRAGLGADPPRGVPGPRRRAAVRWAAGRDAAAARAQCYEARSWARGGGSLTRTNKKRKRVSWNDDVTEIPPLSESDHGAPHTLPPSRPAAPPALAS